MEMPPTRFGNEIKPIRGQPNTGPGAYENEVYTNFQYQTDHYLTSVKGYTMGARTGPRLVEITTPFSHMKSSLWRSCRVRYLVSHQLKLSMGHHEPVNINALPHNKIGFCFELGAHTHNGGLP